MDPYGAEGELLNISNAFIQGQYKEVVDFPTSSLSPENELPARVLKLRAQVALGQAEEVITELEGESEPELAAVKAFAEYAAGNTDAAVEAIEELASASPENPTVQIMGGIVLQAAGKSEEALALLSQHQGSLEAVALIVQIHLQQNRTDLAVKEVQAARRWAQDSLLVNIAESWVGLRVGGERYQQAFYVFEELAQAPSTSSVTSLVSQAVAELHLGRLEEAKDALQQASEKEAQNAEVLANLAVLAVISPKDPKDSKPLNESEEYIKSLKAVSPNHALLQDLKEKSELFDKAAAKFTAKVA